MIFKINPYVSSVETPPPPEIAVTINILLPVPVHQIIGAEIKRQDTQDYNICIQTGTHM